MVTTSSYSFLILATWSLLLFAPTVDILTSQSVAMEMAVILQIQLCVFTMKSEREKKKWAIGGKPFFKDKSIFIPISGLKPLSLEG